MLLAILNFFAFLLKVLKIFKHFELENNLKENSDKFWSSKNFFEKFKQNCGAEKKLKKITFKILEKLGISGKIVK